MKKLATIVLGLAVVAVLVSCSGLKRGQSMGWIDKHTLRIKGIGIAPNPDEVENKKKRQYMAKQAAVINAKNEAVKYIVGSYIESTGATEDGELLGEVVKETASGPIRGAVVIEEKFDDQDNCEVIIEISSDDLKKKLEKALEAYIDDVAGKIPDGE